MMRSLCLIPLLLALARADSFLRLCPQDAPSTVIPDCVARASRQELRELTDEERTWVVDAFRKERAVAPRQKWETILDPPGVYQLIERLDTRLGRRHLSLPYWDTSLELRLDQPGDSILFHPSFLTRSRRRRDRRPLARPKTRFERRIRNPRDDKTTRRLQSQRTRKLLKAIRRDKQSELLFLLFEMGDLFTRISTPIVCPAASPHISCAANSSIPLPKLSPSARCSDALPEDICYHSECISGLCTTVIETPIAIVTRTAEIPIATEPETALSASNETENSTHVELASVDGVSTLSSDAVVQLLSSHEITTSTPVPMPMKRHKQNGWYRYKPKKNDSSTTDPPAKREKKVRQAPHNSDEDLPSPSIVLGGKTRSIDQSVLEKRVERSKHNESPSPLPQVFIPITVIEGPWRGPHRIKQADGVSVTTRGLNSPIGFTATTHGLEVQSSVGLFIVSVPDPELCGPVVEFNVNVTDKANKKCEQFCLSNQSGSYKPCMRSSIKLSPFADFSDPVQWSKTEAAAITSEWIGTGYYRRRRLTPILFSCNKNAD